MEHAKRVRECAAALKTAIAAAKADGYRVDGVGNIDDIAVSVTAKVKLAVEPARSLTRKGFASAPTTPKAVDNV